MLGVKTRESVIWCLKIRVGKKKETKKETKKQRKKQRKKKPAPHTHIPILQFSAGTERWSSPGLLALCGGDTASRAKGVALSVPRGAHAAKGRIEFGFTLHKRASCRDL